METLSIVITTLIATFLCLDAAHVWHLLRKSKVHFNDLSSIREDVKWISEQAKEYQNKYKDSHKEVEELKDLVRMLEKDNENLGHLLAYLRETKDRIIEEKREIYFENQKLRKEIEALKSPGFQVYFTLIGQEEKIMQKQMRIDQTEGFAIVLKDKAGNVIGSPDQKPQWGLSDPTKGDIAISDDGLSGVFTPSGQVGNVQLQALVQVGGVPMQGTLDITLIPGGVASIDIVPQEPVDEPPVVSAPPVQSGSDLGLNSGSPTT